MKDLMENYLHNTEITIFQSREMFRMNTDTRYLGEFMKLKKHSSVLDIGTNNGALLLYASMQTDGKLYGVDVLEAACDLARYNLSYNQITKVEIIHSDVKELVIPQVDAIVCNPPYFPVHAHSNLNENRNLQVARHEKYLELSDLMQVVKRLLKDHGRFFMVHRANRLSDILLALDEAKLGVRRIQFIHDENKDEASGVLIEAAKGQKANLKVSNPIWVKR
ncbi:MAG: tRNA1(Val) (adenine(37)-N6)-methyltransferase [Erysipelotrichaceae bacterium]